jgi:HEAT repeat protein
MKSRVCGLLLMAWPAWAGAPPPPPPPVAEARGDLDGDGRPERVHLEADGTLRVDDSSGRELGRATLPVGAAQLEIVTVEDHVVAHARVPQKGGRAVEVVLAVTGGRAETLALETTGPVGDGERNLRLRVDEAGVVRYQTAPTVTRCDGVDMLFPERWDFSSGRFRPVESEVPEGKLLTISKKAPPDLLMQPLGLFHFTAASTSPDAERHADRLGAPRELEDGRADTSWGAGAGRGAWVTARAPSAAHRLRALRVTPGARGPRALALLVGGEPFRVALAGAEAQWIVLPETQPTGCVSLVVAEPHAAGPNSHDDTSLAEVAIFTDVDVEGGMEQLVAQVATEQPGAAGAELVLAARGAEAAKAIATRLSTGTDGPGGGRRRLLSALAGLRVPEAAPALGKALETASGDERKVVVDGLGHLGAAGAAEGSRVYRDHAQSVEARADAAAVLGATASEADVQALVDGAGDAEPAVRLATLLALEAAKKPEAIARGLAASTECDARTGILARALAHVAPASAGPVGDAWQRCKNSPDVALRLRLVRAAGEAGLSPVAAEAVHDREPVIREAALQAGGALLAEGALSDVDPGVRRAALGALDPKVVAPVVAALGHDAWPMVRRAAAESLGRRCGEPSKQALTSALGKDPAEEVRRESLVALAHCGPVPATLLGGVLASRDQPIAVRELAAAILAKQAPPEAARLLAEAVDDVLADPTADERSASLAIACLRALGRLKDSSRRVLEALGAASNEPLSPAVRAAAVDAIGQLCPEGAGDVFRRAKQDPDPMVRRAAREALDKCHR